MSFWSKLFSPTTGARVAGVIRDVMPIVRVVAAITPTKSDDEILQAATMLGVDDLLRSIPSAKGEAVKKVVVGAAQKKYPEIPADVLSRAVEAAYQQMKAEHAIDSN